MASSTFLNQVRPVIRLKHMSPSTENSYLYYIKQFILFHNKRHPRDMGVNEIRTYLSHLAVRYSQFSTLSSGEANALSRLG